jgi:hypothetical protein
MAACLALMTACAPFAGSSDSESGSGSAAATELTITVQPQGPSGPVRTWTLRCDPPGGNHPRARTACARLTPSVLAPLPTDVICTQIYGGPQTARVRGRFDGRPVDARFGRSNGCEIHRWDSVGFLFPVKM